MTVANLSVPVDMLKAYLLAPIENSEQRIKANQEWKKQVLGLITWGGKHEPERDASCIKAWLRSQYAETIRERKAGATDKDWEIIGTVFHRWIRDNQYPLEAGVGNPEPSNDLCELSLFCQGLPHYSCRKQDAYQGP